jgi:hypothetical protein
MQITVAYSLPSLEFDSIVKALEPLTDTPVRVLNQLDHGMYDSVSDIAVCVGPVAFCPLAKKRVLFVLGQTKHHLVEDWNSVVVTSEKAQSLAFKRFGMKPIVRIMDFPVTALHMGRRRLVDRHVELMHVSEGGIQTDKKVTVLRAWGEVPNVVAPKSEQEKLFKALEFNSRVKAGAIGFYPDSMEDGYDLMVRRHLALGGVVTCKKDKDVLGFMADSCFELGQENLPKEAGRLVLESGEREFNSDVFDLISKVMK